MLKKQERRDFFVRGTKDMLPMLVGVIPFGFIFGSLISLPLSHWHGAFMSLFVFAGSSQLISIGLIAGGTSYLMILFTVFIVNLRHILYSVSLAPYVAHLPLRWRLSLAALLCDETFAIVEQHYKKNPKHPLNHYYFLGAGLSMFVHWQCLTCLGLIFGSAIPIVGTLSLDFALAITFLSIILPKLTTFKYLFAAMIAGFSAYYYQDLPFKLGLIISIFLGINAGLIISYLQKKYSVFIKSS